MTAKPRAATANPDRTTTSGDSGGQMCHWLSVDLTEAAG